MRALKRVAWGIVSLAGVTGAFALQRCLTAGSAERAGSSWLLAIGRWQLASSAWLVVVLASDHFRQRWL